MNPERPNYSAFSVSERKLVPAKRSNGSDLDANMPKRRRFKPSRDEQTTHNVASVDSDIAPSHRSQKRIILEKYLPVFFTDYKLYQTGCVICMSELEKLCPSCEEKELQAANASHQNPCANVTNSCKISYGKCNHVFHDHCLQTWFDESMFKMCPLDRQEFILAKQKD